MSSLAEASFSPSPDGNLELVNGAPKFCPNSSRTIQTGSSSELVAARGPHRRGRQIQTARGPFYDIARHLPESCPPPGSEPPAAFTDKLSVAPLTVYRRI